MLGYGSQKHRTKLTVILHLWVSLITSLHFGYSVSYMSIMGFPCGSDGKESA